VLGWDRKDAIAWRPVAWTIAGGAILLAGATALAPGLWAGAWSEVLATALVPLAPAAAVAAREWFSRRAILVGDDSIVERAPGGGVQRIALRNVRAIRRDLLTGGVRLEGEARRVRIPPTLLDDARAAIALARRGKVRTDSPLDEPGAWLG
jgi:hypothetical protein